jgi:hypothetical protein
MPLITADQALTIAKTSTTSDMPSEFAELGILWCSTFFPQVCRQEDPEHATAIERLYDASLIAKGRFGLIAFPFGAQKVICDTYRASTRPCPISYAAAKTDENHQILDALADTISMAWSYHLWDRMPEPERLWIAEQAHRVSCEVDLLLAQLSSSTEALAPAAQD